VTGRVQRAQTQVADLEDDVIVQQVVVTRQHRGIFTSYPDVDTGGAHLFDRTNVIPVTMGLQHRGDPKSGGDAQQPVVFVGGVEERRLTGPSTTHDVHVVLDRPHDESMHLGHGVGPDHFNVVHTKECHSDGPVAG